VNHPPGANGAALFTPSWGGATPAADGTVEAVIDPLPPATTGADVTGPVVAVKANGNTPIPRTGAVLVLRGTSAQRFNTEAPVGTVMAFRILLNPDWPSAGVVDAVGGGPVLVRDGKPVFGASEQFTTTQLARNPRTGIGQLANGRIVMVVTDGRQRGYSVGMTNFELAQTMVRLGAVTAVAMDAGGSSTIAFDGNVLNRPSDGSERPVSECVCLLYSGVYAPPASEPVLSPNGDGIGETQQLSYKLARPSNVTVQLTGPGRAVRTVDAGAKGPGVYRFSWDGSGTDGGQAPDGRWELSVSATADRGLATSANRGFLLNRTLAGLSLRPALLRAGQLTASFTLSRAARVTVRVETRAGAVLAVASRQQLAAGSQTLSWNGRAGNRKLRAGTYVLRVIAVNEVGSMDLTKQFRLRRR